MPIPIDAIAIAYVCAIAIPVGSIATVSLLYYRRAIKKLKCRPNGDPRPPPGMTRNAVKQAARERLQMSITGSFNFAFCGGSNAGKSTLINALLNRDDVDFVPGKPHNTLDSAPTGTWQTTMATQRYDYAAGHPLQHVHLWDMAGCGTHEHPSATYFEDKVLYAFDVLLIVTEKELGEYEYLLLHKAQQQELPVVVVVSKAEQKVESRIRKLFNTRNPPLIEYQHVVQQTLDEARERVTTCLRKEGLVNVPVFVVSAWKYRDFMREQEVAIGRDDETAMGIEETVREDWSAQSQRTAEDEEREKTALLSFEVNQLLEYIADTVVHRRL